MSKTNQNNIGTYFLYGGATALFIIGCIFVFWVIPMFQKKTSVDCSGNWGDWYCAATCDGINAISSRTGTRKRTYAVTTPASNGGASCPVYAPQTDSTCTKTDCPVNCIGDWNEWSACAATCDGINAISTGTRTRTYAVTTPASNGGSCPTPQTDPTCTKTDCPVNCIGDWNEWSACVATCDGINVTSFGTGTRTRTYAVTTPASNGGSCPIPPPPQTDYTCTKTDCPVNCIGDWNDWSACDATCDGINAISSRPGTRTITYAVTTPASNGGSCPEPQTDSTCIKTDCPVNCIGDWNDWYCAATCDGINSSRTGTRTRTYRVTTPASNGGSCPTPQTNSSCTKTDCPITIATIATTATTVSVIASYPYVPSSGDKYIVFNYTSDSVGLTGQTEYTFTVSGYDLINAKVLIVGGGGGGGRGGGGGGGDVSENDITLPIGSHKIRVGKGGLGSNNINYAGSTGYNSELILQSGTKYTYCGGGGGGSWDAAATAGLTNNTYSSGGGGGGVGSPSSPGAEVGGSGNGFSGNGGNSGNYKGTGGGGGATGHGGNGNGNSNGDGGAGVISNITGSNVGYGGGGGSSGSSGQFFGSNGIDGGGKGANWYDYKYAPATSSVPGINGTGGGGGGGYYHTGGIGGHGVVIIKYKV
jgi:hypothetical protein